MVISNVGKFGSKLPAQWLIGGLQRRKLSLPSLHFSRHMCNYPKILMCNIVFVIFFASKWANLAHCSGGLQRGLAKGQGLITITPLLSSCKTRVYAPAQKILIFCFSWQWQGYSLLAIGFWGAGSWLTDVVEGKNHVSAVKFWPVCKSSILTSLQ